MRGFGQFDGLQVGAEELVLGPLVDNILYNLIIVYNI